MGIVKGIVSGIIALTVGLFVGCGGEPSSTEETLADPQSELSFSSSSVLDEPQSSTVDEPFSSTMDEPFSSAIDVPFSSEIVESSSSEFNATNSAVPFDSAYFGEIGPLSSSTNPPSSSSANEPRRSSSSGHQEPPPPRFHSDYIVGADISRFQEYESYGTKIYDVDGSEKDIFTLLRDHGFNAIRLKTFVSPKAPYGYAAQGCGQDSEAFGDKEHVVAYAQKVKRAGFTFLLDIHYSDVWADPDTQIIPERWRVVTTADAMADSVYAYTFDLLTALKNVDALPDMVQVGNEITNGMLRDLPTSATNCWGDNVVLASNDVNGVMNKQQNPNGIANTVKYLKAGSRAVKDISDNIKTVFHIESPQNVTTVNWWMNSIIKDGKAVPDVMAFSAYSAYQHGTPETWKNLMTDLSKSYPSLEFLIAEYNGGSASNTYGYDGSRARTHQVMEQVPRGLGAFFWEPASYGEWGSSLMDWDGNSLRANEKAFDEYKILF